MSMSDADPRRAAWLMDHGARVRTGRSVGRTIYVQVSDRPLKDDLLIGVMDSPELAERVVRALNLQSRQELTSRDK